MQTQKNRRKRKKAAIQCLIRFLLDKAETKKLNLTHLLKREQLFKNDNY